MGIEHGIYIRTSNARQCLVMTFDMEKPEKSTEEVYASLPAGGPAQHQTKQDDSSNKAGIRRKQAGGG
eukprot:scaffold13617_cov84-Skeletonema_marinoi.AAC.1